MSQEERNRVQNYAENLLVSFPDAKINAYVVGREIGDNFKRTAKVGEHDEGKVFVSTFAQLVDTAEKRLFGLRQKLSSMYDDVPGMDLYNQAKLKFK